MFAEAAGLRQKLEEQTSRQEAQLKEIGQQSEELKKQKYKLEMDVAEVEANYEKDKALWQGKVEFLEEQKDQLRKERDHSQKNFDLMLQKFQKIRSQEKEESQSSQTAIVQNLEARYNSQMSELNEKHKSALQALVDRNTKLEKEIKALNDKLLSENSMRFDNYHTLEKKYNEKAESEKALLEQVSRFKQERDSRATVVQKKYEDELERCKATVIVLEDKLKDADKRRMNQVFEHERDKAKFCAEIDHYNRNKAEMKEANSELERVKDALIKENEKLKNENKRFKLLGSDTTSKLQWKMPTMNTSRVVERSFITEQDKGKTT